MLSFPLPILDPRPEASVLPRPRPTLMSRLLPPLLLLQLLLARRSNSLPLSHAHAHAHGPVSVVSFGAVGDGIHDDGPAIQRAINSFAALGSTASSI